MIRLFCLFAGLCSFFGAWISHAYSRPRAEFFLAVVTGILGGMFLAFNMVANGPVRRDASGQLPTI